MESAAQLALMTGACRYQSSKSILKNSLDVAPPLKAETPPTPPPPPHDNIRGAGHFEGEGRWNMYQQPMINTMISMRLNGMAEALKAQDSVNC